MKRLSTVLLMGLFSPLGLLSATSPLYVNDAPVLFPFPAPQIDATSFVNESIFWVDVTGPLGASETPYQLLNNRYFTNQGSGDMLGYPGFRFEFLSNGLRAPMDTWINKGSIEANSFFDAAWLLVSATNITNRGSMRVDPNGLMRLEGQNVSVSFSELSSKAAAGGGGISLIPWLWGYGTNGVFDGGTNAPTRLDNLNFPQTPIFQMYDGFFIQSGRFPSFSNVVTYAWTNALSSDSTVYHFAFVETNSFETNLTVNASLITNRTPQQLPGSGTIQVDLTYLDYDPSTDLSSTNGITVRDSLAFINSLGLVLPTNFIPNRPNAISITRYAPTNGIPPNSVYSSDVVYNSTYSTNRADMPYAGYFVTVPVTGSGGFFGSDPTNFPGRVEVLGDNVNLNQALIQAESTVILKAKNLASNKVATVIAPFNVLDLASTQPTFTVENLVSADITRLSGDVLAWSGFWTNTIEDAAAATTNYVVVHVLVVEQGLQTRLPVVSSQVSLAATNLVINDLINLGTYAPNTPAYSNYYDAFFSFASGTTMGLRCESLTINNGLSLPPGWAWGATNVQGLLHFTNNGFLFVPRAAVFGTDRAQPYSEIVNRGTLLAGSVSARVNFLENNGVIGTDEGPIRLSSPDAMLTGIPVTSFDYSSNPPAFPPPRPFFAGVGSELRAGGDLEINCGTLTLSNAVLLSGASYVTNFGLAPNNGVFSLNVTNSLTDSGSSGAGPSYIWNHGGVEVPRRPALSDLLRTTLVITSDRSEEIFNVWAGEDRGPNAIGFSNNLALAQLICNFDRNSLVYFTPITLPNGFYATNAIYVENLELSNYATNFATFAINENFTIYFADANMDPALIEAGSAGRMRWVQSFAGPLSSVDYIAANGKAYRMNAALARSMTIDSDGDGIVNGLDEKPFYTPDDAMLSVSLTAETPTCASLSWTAPAHSTNTIEYTATPGSGDWNVLTNFVQGALNTPTTVLDPLSPSGQLRVYRLRVDPKTD